MAVIFTVFSVFLSSLHRENTKKMTSNISLNEDDIPVASLKGRNASDLKKQCTKISVEMSRQFWKRT